MRESRIIPSPTVSIRADTHAAESGPKIVGYAAKFNVEAEIGEGFFEQIAPGAFSQSIGEDDIRCLFNHNPNFPLGRTANKTLLLSEDSVGLRTVCLPPDTQQARDVCESIRRGDITGMSFTFDVRGQSWSKDADGGYHRTLTDCRLYDVGPVTFPAYDSTEVVMRTFNQLVNAWELEQASERRTFIATARRRLSLRPTPPH
ncbi:MAG: HK97 family phage prohead protease [Thermoguttaceae bacterium]